jgi:hypothetical protein
LRIGPHVFGKTSARAIAHIASGWLNRLRNGRIYRYHVPVAQFEDIDDVGMRDSRTPVMPTRINVLDDLVVKLESRNIKLRAMERLTPLKGIRQNTLHTRGIRLRNAQGLGKPRWTHSKPGRPVTINKPVSKSYRHPLLQRNHRTDVTFPIVVSIARQREKTAGYTSES